MAPTIPSAVILSTVALGGKAFLNLFARRRVDGLPILLEALKEPSQTDRKGKGKVVDLDDNDEAVFGRRGIVTGEQTVLIKAAERPSMQPQLGSGRSTCMLTIMTNRLTSQTFSAMIPWRSFFPFASPHHVSRNSRWTLGGESTAKGTQANRIASDVMFTKPLHSNFFNLGQVIETFRGQGVFQPAVDEAVKLLQKGEWVRPS